MKTILKPALAAGIAVMSLAAPALVAPASAQVAGIASATPALIVARAKARGAAYQQIQTTYAAQITQARTLMQEIQTLQTSLDTNNDKQLSDAEVAANPTVVQQIQAKEQQRQQTLQPLVLAEYYVVEQLLNEYGNAQAQVVSDKKIQFILTPDSFQYAPQEADVTEAILTALDARVPTASITVPANWRPRSQQTVQMHEAIDQIMLMAQQQQARAQQQAGQAPAQQPVGR